MRTSGTSSCWTSGSLKEFQICRIPGSVLIPLGDVPQRRSGKPDRTKEIIVHCKMGGRSAKAAAFLRQQGFKNVKNLKGGIMETGSIKSLTPPCRKY